MQQLKQVSNALLLSALALFLLLPMASTPATAQRPKSSSSASKATSGPKALTNDDVIGLTAAGIPDDLIIAKIHAAAATNFDTSLDGLKALKAGGVSNVVIRVLIDPSAAAAPPPPPVQAQNAPPAPAVRNPDDPTQLHAPGIYILAAGIGSDKAVHLTKLDHIVPKQAKSSGLLVHGLTGGIAKAHMKAVIDGPKASVQTSDVNPVFYAYIPEDNSTFGGSAITVKDFSLILFEVKGEQRMASTVTIGFAGVSSGVDDTARQGFTSEVVKPGIYKFTLLKPLPGGEYAFQQSGAAGSSADQKNTGSYFDFGIVANK